MRQQREERVQEKWRPLFRFEHATTKSQRRSDFTGTFGALISLGAFDAGDLIGKPAGPGAMPCRGLRAATAGGAGHGK